MAAGRVRPARPGGRRDSVTELLPTRVAFVLGRWWGRTMQTENRNRLSRAELLDLVEALRTTHQEAMDYAVRGLWFESGRQQAHFSECLERLVLDAEAR